MVDYINAAEASRRLTISRQTLYAYVSRGLLKAIPAPDPRQSLYLASAVDQLAATRKRGRKPREIAKATLDWGPPVLESALTLIDKGQIYYRGHNGVELSKTQSLEDIAALLWQTSAQTAFPRRAPINLKAYQSLIPQADPLPANETLLPLFAITAADDATSLWRTDKTQLARGAGDLVRLLTACALRKAPNAAPIHKQLAQAWQLDDKGAELIRQALALCADHELNASSFTARCVASTGASLKACCLAALGALSGVKHGATTTQIEYLWNRLVPHKPETGLRNRLSAGEAIPGFGHPLYPDGDIRAKALLETLLPNYEEADTFTAAVKTLTGLEPTIDFALVALRRHLMLPEGAAFLLFAIGRSTGWIAHALEQRQTNQLIRPRAIYTGPTP